MKKLTNLFLTLALLFTGIVNVKAFDNIGLDSTKGNDNIVMNFLGEDSSDIGNYITLKKDLKDDNAKVSYQIIGINEEKFRDIQAKYGAYEAVKESSTATPEEQMSSMNTYIASIPNFNASYWTDVSSTIQKTSTTNKYSAKVDEKIEYFVAWVKVESNGKTIYKWNVNCLAHIPRYCESYNEKYYNSKGEEVTKEAYYKDCFKCEKVGDDYINSKGEIVTEEAYRKDCFSCKVENGKYYNNDGKEVTYSEYRKDCFPNCKVENGKYYDNDGNEITKEKYQKLCESPKTGNQTFYAYGVAAVAVAFILYMFTRKIRKFSK